MNKEKQIAEMARDLHITNDCAEYFMNSLGYRKQSEGENMAIHPTSAFECSICKWENWDLATGDGAYNYCPNCGAKMKGGAE